MRNEYEICGDKVSIFLKRKDGSCFETLIDLFDLNKVMSVDGWYVHERGYKRYYVVGSMKLRKGKHKLISLHRFLTEPQKDLVVDHIDRDPMNNTRVNLRVVYPFQNAQNLGVNKKNNSGVRGVRWHKQAKKWAATVRVKGYPRYEEFFYTKEEAVKAVIEARKKLMPFSHELL